MNATETLVLRLSPADLAIVEALIRRLESRPDRPRTKRGPEKISKADAIRDLLRLGARMYRLPVRVDDS